MRTKHTRRRWMASVVGLGLLGCLSPTMPLPPPAKPMIDGPDATGTVVLSGQIVQGSHVYADNLTTGYSAGQIVDPARGTYRFSIKASVGDSMALFYRAGVEESQPRLFKIPEPGSAASTAGSGGQTSTTQSSVGSSSGGGSSAGASSAATGGATTGSEAVSTPSAGGAL